MQDRWDIPYGDRHPLSFTLTLALAHTHTESLTLTAHTVVAHKLPHNQPSRRSATHSIWDSRLFSSPWRGLICFHLLYISLYSTHICLHHVEVYTCMHLLKHTNTRTHAIHQTHTCIFRFGSKTTSPTSPCVRAPMEKILPAPSPFLPGTWDGAVGVPLFHISAYIYTHIHTHSFSYTYHSCTDHHQYLGYNLHDGCHLPPVLTE